MLDYRQQLLPVDVQNEIPKGADGYIASVSSVAIIFFVISIPCVVSTRLLVSWFIIFAFTFTGMVLLTLPFAINIALSTLLRIAFP
jgi:hypothetical protein